MSKTKKPNKNIPVKIDAKANDFFAAYQDEFNPETELVINEGHLSCDVYQDENNIIVKSAVAGVEPENLEIAINGDLLTIRGARHNQEKVAAGNFYSQEIYWGVFSRSIILPQEINQEKISATLRSGILTLTLPKKYKSATIKVKKLDD